MTDNDSDYEDACKAYEAEDYDKAYELFYALALESDVSCQVNIANMLMHGLGVEQNEDRAFEWYEQAALNEDKVAQYIYGWYCIHQGDEEEGLKQVTLASDALYLDALYDLASFYAQGLYTCPKDLVKASDLYEKAIGLGKKEAIGRLFSIKKESLGLFQSLIYFAKNVSSFAGSISSKT